MGALEYYIIMGFMALVGVLGISFVFLIEFNDRKAAKVNQLEKI